MSSNNQPLSGNSIAPIQKVSLNSLITSVILDADPNDSSLLVKTGNNSSLYIDKYSNVGINTTSPGAQLEVSSSNGACVKLRYGNTSATSNISINNSGHMSLATSGNEIITSSNLNISSHNGTTTGLKLNNTLVVATANQLNYNTVTAGTAVAGKVLVLDENRNISNINTITSTNLTGTIQTAAQPNITSVGTLSNLSVIGDLTVSGNFNLTGGGGSIATSLSYLDGVTPGTAIASKVLILDSNKSISTITSLGVTTLVLGGNTLGATQASYLTGNTAGTAIASKALVLDVNKNITSINSLSASTLTGTLQTAAQPNITSIGTLSSLSIGSATLNEVQANYLVGITPGTSSASKALILDANRDITNIRYLTASQLNGQIQTASQPLITSIGTLNALMVSGSVSIQSTTDATSSTDGGALTVSGGLAVAKSVFIGSHLIVGGNLTVNGTTTTVNTTNVSIRDNTIHLNASPSGSYDSGLIIHRYQTANNASSGDVISDTAKVSTTITAATSSTATLSSGSAIDNYYNGWWIKVNSEVRKVISYVGSTRVLTLETNFNSTPTNGTNINLFNKSFAAIVWNEANKQFVSAFTSTDSAATLTMLDEADMKVSNLFTSAKIIVNDVTDSSATTNGSIITSGGLGIAKTLRVGTGIYGTLLTATQTNITTIGTLSTLTVSGNITIGGTTISSTEVGYLTGNTLGTATASKALLIDTNKNITGINILGTSTLSLGETDLTSVQANYLTSISTGTASASKALILDANRDIVNIRNFTATNLTGTVQTAAQPNITSLGTLTSITIGSATLTDTQAAYLTGITAGTALASKALVLDGSLNISGINSISTTTLVLGGTSLGTTQAAYLTGITAGTALASKALVLDGSLNISGINSIGTTTLVLGGTSLGTTQAGYLTEITTGTALASKALILDGSLNISGINSIGTTTLVLGGTSLGTTQAGYLTGITDGTALGNKALIVDANRNISNLNSISFYSNASRLLTLYRPGMSHNGTTNIAIGTASGTDQHGQITFAYKTLVAGTSMLSLGHYGTEFTLNVLSNGNVGLGTQNPGYKLDVNGSLNATSLYINGLIIDFSSINGVIAGTATASKALILDASKNITGINSINTTELIVNGVNITSGGADASPYVTDVTPGTAIASKSLIVDASKNITGINTIGATTLTLGSTSLTTTEAAYLTGITAGSSLASKALITDANVNITGINTIGATTLTLGSTSLTTTEAAYLTNSTPGTAIASKALIVSGNRDITNINTLNITNTFLTSKSTATGAYVGAWSSSNYYAIGPDTTNADNVVRIGISSWTGTWSGYASVRCAAVLATSYALNGVAMNTTALTNTVSGTATASKVLIPDTNKDIVGFNILSATTLGGTLSTAAQPNITSLGTLTNVTIGSSTIGATQAAYLTDITAGTSVASKALIVDASKNITGIGSIGLSGQNVMLDLYAATAANRSAFTLRNDTRTVEVGLQGTTATTNADLFYIYSNAAYRLLMNTNGNMGIGAAPNASYNLNTTSFNATSYYLNGSILNVAGLALLPATATGTAAASTALVLDVSLNISGINSIGTTTLVLGGNSLGATQAAYLTGITAGTAVANKALIVDASSNITGINSLTTGTLVLGSTSLTTTEATYLTGIVAGNATASKALIVNASRNITNINSLTTTTLVLGSTSLTTTEATYLTGITPGTATASRALILDGNKSITGINSISIDATVTPLIINNSSTTGRTVMRVTSDTKTWEIGSTGSANATFPTNSFMLYDSTAASVRMVVLTSGDIGIGKTNPTYKLDVNGSFNATSFNLSGTTVPLTLLTGVTAGTALASKAVTLDSSSNVTGINSLTTTTLVLGATSLTSTQAAYLTGVTLGSGTANKVLTLDSAKNLTSMNNIYSNGTFSGVYGSASQYYHVSRTAAPAYVGSWASTGYYAIGADTSLDDSTIRLGTVNGSFGWSGYANIKCATVNCTSLLVNGSPISGESVYTTGITAGTATASKALVVDASRNIANINNITSTGYVMAVEYYVGNVQADVNALTGVAAGTAEASKALIIDASKNIVNINSITTTNLVLGTTTLTTTEAAYLTGITPGTALASKALILDSSRNIGNINNISSTGYYYNNKNTASGTIIGNWLSSSFWGIGPDTSSNDSTVRIGICSSSTGTWSGGLAHVKCGNVNATGYLLSGTTLDFSSIAGVTAGTALASKALIVDASRNITNVGTIGITSTSNNALQITNSATTGLSNIKLISDTKSFEIGSRGSTAAYPNTFYIWDNTASLMRFIITSGGNIGIGLTDASYKLDVSGSINGTSYYQNGTAYDISLVQYLGSITFGTAAASKSLITDASRNIGNLNNVTSVGQFTTSIKGQGFIHNDGTISLITYVNSTAVPTAAYIGTSTAHNLVLQTAGASRCTIDQTGDVSATSFTIGGTKLTSTQANYLTGVAAGTATASKVLIVDASSNIIGINSVTTNGLTVGNTSGSSNWLSITTDSGRWQFLNVASGYSPAGALIIGAYSSGGGSLGNAITITQNLSVGINMTPSSSYKLDVNGAVNATTYYQAGSLVDLASITGVIAGTAAASKALILNASRNITNIGSITVTADISSSGGRIYTSGNFYAQRATASGTYTGAWGSTSWWGIGPDTAGTDSTIRIGVSDSFGVWTGALANLKCGNINATSFSLSGSIVDLASITGVTAGTSTASKALIVDASKNIAGINNITGANSIAFTSALTSYSPISAAQTSGPTIPLQLNTTGYSYFGPTNAFAFAIQTNNAGRIFITSAGNVGIGVVPSVSYGLTTTSFNATAYSLNGSAVDFSPITGVTAGTAAASKALILDSSRNISNILSINSTSLFIADRVCVSKTSASAAYVGYWSNSGTWGIGPDTTSADNTVRIGTGASSDGTWNGYANLKCNLMYSTGYCLNGVLYNISLVDYINGLILGTASPSKCLTTNANNDITGLRNITMTGRLQTDTYIYSSKGTASATYVGNWASSSWWGIGPDTSNNDSALRIGISDSVGVWTGSYAHVKCGTIQCYSTMPYTIGSHAYYRSDALFNTGTGVTNNCSGFFASRIVVGGEINVFSDYRTKNNISNLSIDYCKKFIYESRPVKFHYNNDSSQAHFGYIAQEVLKSGFDDLITMAPNDDVDEILEEDGFLNPKGSVFVMSTSELIPLLAVNIKELYKENEELKAKVIANETKSIENENKINKLEELVNSLINRLNTLENK